MTGGRLRLLLFGAFTFGSLALLTGCGTGGLEVHYPQAAARPSLLATLAPNRVDVRPVADLRRDPARIGATPDKRDLVTSRPVVDVVRDALLVELEANGLTPSSDEPAALLLAAAVEDFWLDVVGGYSALQYLGRVAIAVTVSDGRTGTTLISRRYMGIKRARVDEASDDAARAVLDQALARTIHDLATDPALIAALAAPGVPPPR